MKQTAIEWLVENLSLHNDVHFVTQNKRKIIEQAKAMEKDQISDAHNNGFEEGHNHVKSNYTFFPKDGLQYYEDTYNGQVKK
jgi:hypothetical protein